jgi:hypothetical protein
MVSTLLLLASNWVILASSSYLLEALQGAVQESEKLWLFWGTPSIAHSFPHKTQESDEQYGDDKFGPAVRMECDRKI